MRTDKMHPLPWKHETDGKKMSAVVDAEGKVVCGSFLVQQAGTGTKDRQTHAYIVYSANKANPPDKKTCPNCGLPNNSVMTCNCG